MDAPILMPPRMRYEYRVTHDATEGRRGDTLHSILESPYLRQRIAKHIKGLKAPVCYTPGCRCTPLSNETLKSSTCGTAGEGRGGVLSAVDEVMSQVPIDEGSSNAASGLNPQPPCSAASHQGVEEGGTSHGDAATRGVVEGAVSAWEKEETPDDPHFIPDWCNFTESPERVLAMAREVAACYSMPLDDRLDPVAAQIRRWRRSFHGNGKVVTAAYYSPWDANKTGTYLRHEWIEEWMEHHRTFYDAVPQLCNPMEDDAQVGFQF